MSPLLTVADIKRLAAHLGLTVKQFRADFVKTDCEEGNAVEFNIFPRTPMTWVLFLLGFKKLEVETGKAVHILSTCRWVYEVLLNRKEFALSQVPVQQPAFQGQE